MLDGDLLGRHVGVDFISRPETDAGNIVHSHNRNPICAEDPPPYVGSYLKQSFERANTGM